MLLKEGIPSTTGRLGLRGPGAVGPLLMLASALLFAVLDALIKLLGPSFRVWDIAFYRFSIGMLILVALFGWRSNPFSNSNPKLMTLRGIIGSISFLTLVVSIRVIPISTALVLFYSFPAFAALFSALLYKEHVSRAELGCILATVFGVTILFDFHLQGALFGQIMALLSAASAGLAVSIIKKLRENHGSVVIYLHFCLLGTIISLPPFFSDPQLPRTGVEWLMIGGIILSSILAQLLMNEGFRYCKSWEGGVFLTNEVIFTSIFGIVFLRELITWRFCIGGFLILASILALNRQIAKRDPRRCMGDSES